MAVKTTRSARGILNQIYRLARDLHEHVSRKVSGDVNACERIAHGVRRLNLLDKKLVYAFLGEVTADIKASNNAEHIKRIKNVLRYLMNDERIALGQHRYLYMNATNVYHLAIRKQRELESKRLKEVSRIKQQSVLKENMLERQRIMLRRKKEEALRKARKG